MSGNDKIRKIQIYIVSNHVVCGRSFLFQSVDSTSWPIHGVIQKLTEQKFGFFLRYSTEQERKGLRQAQVYYILKSLPSIERFTYCPSISGRRKYLLNTYICILPYFALHTPILRFTYVFKLITCTVSLCINLNLKIKKLHIGSKICACKG